MDYWRRQKGENYQDVSRTKWQNKRPPLGGSPRQVPSWEKKFCSTAGVSWKKLLDTKKLMYLYDNIVQWDDSAGEESFHNAKQRFHAEINGLDCEVPVPGPDIYIDEIDWNNLSEDVELLLDWEREPVEIDNGGENHESVVIFGGPLELNQNFSCVGWGEEEDFKKPTDSFPENRCEFREEMQNPKNPFSHENSWENTEVVTDARNLVPICHENPWEKQESYPFPSNHENPCVSEADNGKGWGSGWDSSTPWNCENQWESRGEKEMGYDDNLWVSNQWNNNNNSYGFENSERHNRRYGVSEPQDVGWNQISRYKTSRFNHDDHQMDRRGRNGRGRNKRESMWTPVNSCGPATQNGSRKPGNACWLEKSVL